MYAISKIALLLAFLASLLKEFNGLPITEDLIDLSYPFDENTNYWVNTTKFRWTKKQIVDKEDFFYSANEFEASEHGGTHIDAPYHFYKDGLKVDKIPIGNLIVVNGIKIDAKEEAAANPNYGLELSKLTDWEKRNGNITFPTVIVMDFGWARKYSNRNEYYGTETFQEGDLHFPGVSLEAAQWIANNEKIVGVGLDTPSVDAGQNSNSWPAHINILGANKYNLENLALDGVNLPEKGFKLYVSPMKIGEGTGAPCRVIASVNRG